MRPQNEHVAFALGQLGREGDPLLDVFLSQHGSAGRNTAEQGNAGDLVGQVGGNACRTADRAHGLLRQTTFQFDAARGAGVTLDGAFLLQRGQVDLDAARGGELQVRHDLTDRGRHTVLVDVAGDRIQHALLGVGQVVVFHRVPLVRESPGVSPLESGETPGCEGTQLDSIHVYTFCQMLFSLVVKQLAARLIGYQYGSRRF